MLRVARGRTLAFWGFLVSSAMQVLSPVFDPVSPTSGRRRQTTDVAVPLLARKRMIERTAPVASVCCVGGPLISSDSRLPRACPSQATLTYLRDQGICGLVLLRNPSRGVCYTDDAADAEGLSGAQAFSTCASRSVHYSQSWFNRSPGDGSNDIRAQHAPAGSGVVLGSATSYLVVPSA